MDTPDIYMVIVSLFTLLVSSVGVFFAFPAIKDAIGAANSDFIRIAIGAFAGSSSAGIIYLYIREKFHTMPLLFKKGHVIVCGLNPRSFLVINDLVRRKMTPVIIESDAKNTFIESCNMLGIIVLVGLPCDPNMLSRAGVKKAAYVLSLNEVDEDNAEVALTVMRMVPEKKHQDLTCIIQVINPQLYGIIRKHAFSSRRDSSVRIEFFNQYALGARALLERYPAFPSGEKGAAPLPIVILGAGRLGENILTRIARTWYLLHKGEQTRLTIILVDINAVQIRENLLIQFPKLANACDLGALTLDVGSAAFKTGDYLKNPLLERGFVAYICLDDDSLGLYAALTLHHQTAGKEVRFIVRMDHNTSVAKLIADEQVGFRSIRGIYPVNMFELTANSQLILAGEEEILARAIHENYCTKEQMKGHSRETNPLLVSWDELGELTQDKDGIYGEKYRQSNREQANFIWTKISLAGCEIGPITDWDAPVEFRFTRDETEQLSSLEHERWMTEKLEGGWHYGEQRDDTKSIHPSLVPYGDLSESEKEKDRDTIRQIPEILSLIDFQVYRQPVPSTERQL